MNPRKIPYKISEIGYKYLLQYLVRLFVFVGLVSRFLIGFDFVNNYISKLSKVNIQFALRLFGAKIGKNCTIETGIRIHNCNRGYSNLVIGDNCHLGKDCFLDLKERIFIEDNVVVSMQSSFITHIDMGAINTHKYPTEASPIRIKKNVYIGARSTILKGITIGENSIIGAGSLVINDIKSFETVAGVPAKKLI